MQVPVIISEKVRPQHAKEENKTGIVTPAVGSRVFVRVRWRKPHRPALQIIILAPISSIPGTVAGNEVEHRNDTQIRDIYTDRLALVSFILWVVSRDTTYARSVHHGACTTYKWTTSPDGDTPPYPYCFSRELPTT